MVSLYSANGIPLEHSTPSHVLMVHPTILMIPRTSLNTLHVTAQTQPNVFSRTFQGITSIHTPTACGALPWQESWKRISITFTFHVFGFQVIFLALFWSAVSFVAFTCVRRSYVNSHSTENQPKSQNHRESRYKMLVKHHCWPVCWISPGL